MSDNKEKPRKPRAPGQNSDVHARLQEHLEFLGLTKLAESYRDHLAQAAKGNQNHLDFLDAMLTDEANSRFDRRVRRRIARAGFPVVKTIETFDWTHPSKIDRQRILALFDLDILAKKRNALLVGPTGLGKTHLGIALGVAACQKGHNVLFRTAMDIVNELQAAQSDATSSRSSATSAVRTCSSSTSSATCRSTSTAPTSSSRSSRSATSAARSC